MHVLGKKLTSSPETREDEEIKKHQCSFIVVYIAYILVISLAFITIGSKQDMITGASYVRANKHSG